ncbi:MAG TPA: 4-(cytidine 5'-diphospho)-2-C-methyl-D-erythritol kinase [Lacunisphaera sp.]|jgi:4-diphosphocytidyl-2-C-methyl-D-erythritol kinase|nr:4-(cytidine 5'-diphospho)-2-C-methyl-D-erythritol kinase [Lacunisphaera sp.]
MERSVFSPAKLNLFLAVTGRRADGFHDLVSLAAPLDFGDELAARPAGRAIGPQFSLACDDPAVPVDASNLVLRAAAAFAAATGWRDAVHFRLTKRIPAGAGLGGGSSNAVAALRVLNELAGRPLAPEALAGLAAGLGSDCALFLANAPVVMRGRGERVAPLAAAAAARVSGRRVLLFKPDFSIGTAWAYGRMVATGTDYRQPAEAEARLAAWLDGAARAEELLANNMEGVAFEKFIALPVMLAGLRREFGLAPRMSGSGSACYALLGDDGVTEPIGAYIRARWGPTAFIQAARLA